MTANWYIVHAYSNFEKKVADAILLSAKEKGLDKFIEEVFVPTEDVTEVRRGRKINTERRFFPGYVLVKMALNDQIYHLVKDTPKVTGFLGSGNKPMPVPMWRWKWPLPKYYCKYCRILQTLLLQTLLCHPN